jgi:SagB-type dehydrogenase family enzyme
MMRNWVLVVLVFAAALCVPCGFGWGQPASTEGSSAANEIALPPPATAGKMSVEEALSKRRSVRKFSARDLTIEQIGQLAWAAQGITDQARGFRTAPSAVATYPLEIYLVKRDGIFRYIPRGHKLLRLATEDRRAELCGQASVREAPVDIVITGALQRATERFRARAERFVSLEAGHVAQNILLQAVALGLGSVPVGGYDERAVANVLKLPAGETALYIIPVGHPAEPMPATPAAAPR